MIRNGHILLKLSDRAETRAPVHLDVLDGVKRPGGSVDGNGAVDSAIRTMTSGMRCRRCFHASASLSHSGERHTCYNPLEHDLGLDRVLSVQIADADRTPEVVQALRNLDAVDWAMIEPLAAAPLRANLPEHAAGSIVLKDAFDRVGAATALAMEPGSRSIPVAVIDTGVALEHHEFNHKLLTGYDTVDLGIGPVGGNVSLVGDSMGRDFCARDETGHGTHVAGIVGARGLSMPQGLGGRSPIIPVRALAAAQAGDGPVFGVGGLGDIDAAIKVAVDMGARVLNMSFGTARNDLDPDAPPPHRDVIDYANAQSCICVAAMGNSGLEETFYPAALPGCIAVGSMSLAGELSEFSTTGAHVALCAPGEEVFSAGLSGYCNSTGTSHAAPFVAGAAALLAARAERRGHRLTGDEARIALCHSADRVGEPDALTGWGMLNAPAALAYLDHMQFSNQEDER